MLPEGWRERRFSEVVRIAEGQVDPTQFPYSGYLHIGPENIESGTGRLSALSTAGDLGLISGKYEFDESAIVYSKIRPNLNKVARPRFRGICSADMYPLWGNETEVSTEYLYHYLLGPTFLSIVTSFSMRTGLPKVNRSDLSTIEIALPSLPEQKKIADILSTWDAAIETAEKLLANAEHQKRALMQQLLTGKRRLKGFGGKWSFEPLSQLSSRIQRTDGGGQHPILTISSTTGFMRQDEKYSRYMAGKSAEKYVLLRKGEFAYNKGNSKTYEFGCVFPLESFDAALVPHVYVCFALNPGLHAPFYTSLFAADYLRPQLRQLVKTGVRNNGLLNIRPSEFMGVRLPVPPHQEQVALGDLFEAADKRVRCQLRDLDRLKVEKSALMQQLLTGKRRVTV